MSAPEFLDSNILVYAYDDTEPRKKGIARDFLRRAVLGEFVASTQTLAELATTLLHKFSPHFRPQDVLAILDTLSPIKLVLPDGGIVRRAVEARENYGLHFYDGMIVAAAERAGCERIWSEDLNAGQKYFGVEVRNPFKE
jgi:predicted nucleic acid-binding protein